MNEETTKQLLLSRFNRTIEECREENKAAGIFFQRNGFNHPKYSSWDHWWKEYHHG